MTRKNLPKDMRQYTRRFVLKRIVPCTLLFITFALVLFFFGKTLFRTEIPAFRSSCYVIVLMIPFWITGVPFKLFDRTYQGVVESVAIENNTQNVSAVKPTREHLMSINTIYLTIRLPNGKIRTQKVYEGEAKLQQHLDTYQEGDRVFHLYGSPYTVVLPKESASDTQCAVCGASNPMASDICRNCGHTLIKADRDI